MNFYFGARNHILLTLDFNFLYLFLLRVCEFAKGFFKCSLLVLFLFLDNYEFQHLSIDFVELSRNCEKKVYVTRSSVPGSPGYSCLLPHDVEKNHHKGNLCLG